MGTSPASFSSLTLSHTLLQTHQPSFLSSNTKPFSLHKALASAGPSGNTLLTIPYIAMFSSFSPRSSVISTESSFLEWPPLFQSATPGCNSFSSHYFNYPVYFSNYSIIVCLLSLVCKNLNVTSVAI